MRRDKRFGIPSSRADRGTARQCRTATHLQISVIPTPIPVLPGTVPHFLLWMGDSGLTTPIAAVVAAALVVSRGTRLLAMVWCAAFVGSASIVFATKLGVFGWGEGFDAISFRGPSGHATLAACVWPAVAWLLTSRAPPVWRRAAVGAGAAVALGVAWTLATRGYHTLPEVAAGTLLGAAAAGWFLRAVASCVRPPPTAVLVVAGLLIAGWLSLQHGKPFGPLDRAKADVHRWVEGRARRQ